MIWSAASLGLCLLTRQTLAPLAIVSVPILLAWCAVHRTGWRNAAAAIAVAALLLLPWTARNFIQSGRFPVLQTWVGQPMFQGVYVSRHLPEFLKREKSVSDLDAEALAVIRDQTSRYFEECPPHDNRPVAREVLADRFAKRQARAAFLEAPLDSLGFVIRNLIFAPVLQMTWKSTVILMIWNWPLLILSTAGAILCFRRQRGKFLTALPVTMIFCYLLGVHSVVWPQARYIMPGLLPFSAFAGFLVAETCSKPRKIAELWPKMAKKR